ncbi:hypothetical protein GGS20DRAFT_575991 [Poronia punctata]|nr:hypothetical protein GGS20DRAFT_575991 [Poronia punctata]
MSRSVDKSLLSQIRAEDPTPVYNELSSIFTNLPDTGLLEIEFLGRSHPLDAGVNYLRDGDAVAIPKVRLLQAFSVARQILQAYLLNRGTSGISADVIPATAILLLMDPEHLTAANTRKRALMLSGNPTTSALERERRFVDTLLTARLHRHTKSPTLWSHRRWLITTARSLGIPCDIRHDIQNVVMVAGERHPRNYNAWQYARFFVGEDSGVAATLAFDMKEFCLRNHTDISAWSFLYYCLTKIQEPDSRAKIFSTIIQDILAMVDSFRWANESVWVFLRTVLAREADDDDNMAHFIAANERLSLAVTRNSSQVVILERARQWCANYRTQS